jgi:hypothetical protein
VSTVLGVNALTSAFESIGMTNIPKAIAAIIANDVHNLN